MHHGSWQDPRCEAFPDPGNMVVAVKMSASQVKLEQLNRIANIFHCLSADKLLLLSDVDQTLGPYKLHNYVSDSNPGVMNWHNALGFNRKQQDYARRGLEAKSFGSKTPVLAPETLEEKEKGLHIMDKYKFLHMVEKAWELQPNMDWYVFPDIQGFYYWSNLVRWLREIDPSQPRFLGKASRIASSKLDIANDWAGVVLPGAAVKALVSRDRTFSETWDKKIEYMDSGQHVLATALHSELDLKLTDIWPLFIGEVLGRIPFKQEIWCEPVIGLSDVPSELIQALLQAEQLQLQNAPTAIITYRDLFHHLSGAYPPPPPPKFPGSDTIFLYQRLWDNIADSTQYHEEHLNWTDPKLREDQTHFIHTIADPNGSMAACAAACDAFAHCIQFAYMEYAARVLYSGRKLRAGGSCHLSKVYRYGLPREMHQWDDEGAEEKFLPGSVGNTQVYSSAWNRRRWDDYTRGLVCH